MSNRLVSFSDLAAFLETDYTETQNEGIPLANILDAMTAVFEQYLKRTLSYGTYTEDYWGTGITVPLNALPVASITSVTYQTSPLQFTSDYIQSPAGIRLTTILLDGSAPVTVTYTGGYTVDDSGTIQVPADMKQAALYQIAYEWKQKDKPGATLIETAAGRLTIPGLQLLNYVTFLLNPYIHPAFLI